MRPLNLEIEGFASFRQRTEIDFGDAELFALTGPTGSGKSSILDGIAFALYGSVPRFDSEKLVWPAISRGKQEAKVALQFAIGETAYRVVRVVRRNGDKGASTKEARLEQGDVLLAGDERGVTEQVEKLLGLTFSQFTRCVMLPQGEFAQFLKDKPAERNDLLRRLLGIDQFKKMGARAREKADSLKNEADLVSSRLQDLEGATPAGKEGLKKRIGQLKAMLEEIGKAQKDLDKAREALQAESARAKGLEESAKTLGSIKKPEGVEALAQRIKDAKDSCEKARQAHSAKKKAYDEALSLEEGLPEKADSADAVRKWNELEQAQARLRQAASRAAETEGPARQAETALREAGDQRDLASARLAKLETSEQAYAIAAKMTPGDPCPVCGGTFAKYPGSEPEDIVRAKATLNTAGENFARAEKALRDAEKRHHESETLAKAEEKAAQAAKAAVEGLPAKAAAEEALAKLQEAESKRKAARLEADEAQKKEASAQLALRAAEEAAKKAQFDFKEVRGNLKDFSPPDAAGDDLAAWWEQLEAWAAVLAESKRGEAEKARAAIRTVEGTIREIGEALDAAVAGAAVERGTLSHREAGLLAVQETERALQDLESRIEERKQLEERRKGLLRDQSLYAELAKHLKTNKFEQWYFDRTFQDLSEGASTWLSQLSSQQYSIDYDGKEFQVVDHANAGETRPVYTLSGGETFLASLSLALSLSDHIALSSASQHRLESLFLDEGFGTLDSATLDQVAAAIEELGTRGRIVGVITHVSEFAERIPVRFEVRRTEGGSTVQRVVA